MEVSHLSVADISTAAGVPGGAVVDKIASDLGHGLLVSAKSKSAQSDSDKGNYWTLRPYLKNLIQIPQYIIDQVKGQNITYFAVLCLPAQAVGANNTQIIKDLQTLSSSGLPAGSDPTSQAAKATAKQVIGSGGTAVAPGSAAAGVSTVSSLTKYIPYIIGGVVLIIIIYFIIKKKK